MIDLHFHVLPGIDDGADDLETAVAMCRLAGDDGCEAVVATPHQRTEMWENTDLFALEELRRRVAAAVGERPRLELGGEVRVDSALLAELEEAAPGSGPAALAGSRYLLLELDRFGTGPHPAELAHEVIVGGRVPIFAHPEMIPALAGDLDLVARLVAAGALFQITAMSVTGDFGRTARSVCHRLLDRDLVHFVASDAHGVRHRPPGLSGARDEIARRWGEDLAWRLTRDNPRAVLEDRPLAVPPDDDRRADPTPGRAVESPPGKDTRCPAVPPPSSCSRSPCRPVPASPGRRTSRSTTSSCATASTSCSRTTSRPRNATCGWPPSACSSGPSGWSRRSPISRWPRPEPATPPSSTPRCNGC